MPLDVLRVDVAVVGFGIAGAAAALRASETGATVLAVDQDPVPERSLSLRPSADADRDALRENLRAAARAAGVTVRPQCRVHELLVAGGRVCGLGCAALPAGGARTAVHRWSRRMGGRVPGGLRPAFARAAETAWRSGFEVGEVSCPLVVLALDPRHWEFVGPAMWAEARAREWSAVPPAAGSVGAPGVVGSPVRPTPELAVRTWCAQRESDPVAAGQPDLRVDERTGAVGLGGGPPVPGLYAAVATPRVPLLEWVLGDRELVVATQRDPCRVRA